ncbi:MAG: FADH(2)-oxidizing methylenetetrahydrofolate--tRNA-(uracil(54)-C(5))-methyltransferase TrmFO [Clostridiales bacterium]|nr:FADH(2)-oxidizing methylenetetrahydrofolate--tRNA-(uracil(54)-C(5))-methyltransferase TrmFO [Clostridiales bacterium]
MIERDYINVIGAGLAGTEAAIQIASHGIPVKLYDMKPGKKSAAHSSNLPAELVCSNSLKAMSLDNASGILKKEMQALGSVVIESAYENKVPAGGALAVDRERFSEYINNKIISNKLIEYIHSEINEIPKERITIIATGPLTSNELAMKIMELSGNDGLYFFDAAAPVISTDSINYNKVFIASRYGKGSADYINCPMDREQYAVFYNFLVIAKTIPLKDFEKSSVFEGCMPVEVMAKRGFDTLRFGPMKPVGLPDPITGKEYYAIVQLRSENTENTQYNLVGFQTNLKFKEQKKLLELIPGLENADIERYGVMHRNTYLKSPGFINKFLQVKEIENLFFAGQITGVEGYLESASSGILAGINATKMFNDEKLIEFPDETIMGSLANYVSGFTGKDFQPMNANFGILPPLKNIIKNKKERRALMAERSINSINKFRLEL